MKTKYKILATFVLIAILALAFSAPAQAFDGRNGEKITIAADEVVEGDLYVNAGQLIMDGAIKGDLVAAGSILFINGTVEGDVIAAGQSVIINGKVEDDVRMAGAVLYIGENAAIGSDVIAAGASIEAQEGSSIQGELVAAAAQILLAGNISGDVQAGAGALELRGQFGGDVHAEVGDPEQDGGGPPMSTFFDPATFGVSVPNIVPGFTVSENAKIKGNLEYTQSRDVNIPSNVVGGSIKRNEPVIDLEDMEAKPTPEEIAIQWTLDLLRTIVTLALFGLLLGWLAPAFSAALMEKIQSRAAASLGWGFVAYAAFFFSILLILIVMIFGAIFFGALTLNGISGTIVWVGILALLALIIGFILAVAFVSKIITAWLGGRLLLNRLNPSLAQKKFAPLILGVVLLAILMALPFIGWIFSALAVLSGLGAIWLWGSDLWQARKAATQAVQI